MVAVVVMAVDVVGCAGAVVAAEVGEVVEGVGCAVVCCVVCSVVDCAVVSVESSESA